MYPDDDIMQVSLGKQLLEALPDCAEACKTLEPNGYKYVGHLPRLDAREDWNSFKSKFNFKDPVMNRLKNAVAEHERSLEKAAGGRSHFQFRFPPFASSFCVIYLLEMTLKLNFQLLLYLPELTSLGEFESKQHIDERGGVILPCLRLKKDMLIHSYAAKARGWIRLPPSMAGFEDTLGCFLPVCEVFKSICSSLQQTAKPNPNVHMVVAPILDGPGVGKTTIIRSACKAAGTPCFVIPMHHMNVYCDSSKTKVTMSSLFLLSVANAINFRPRSLARQARFAENLRGGTSS